MKEIFFWRKIKNRFKVEFKLILIVCFYIILGNLKICKILRNFDYIKFFYTFHNETKHEKIIFLSIFFFSLYLNYFGRGELTCEEEETRRTR